MAPYPAQHATTIYLAMYCVVPIHVGSLADKTTYKAAINMDTST